MVPPALRRLDVHKASISVAMLVGGGSKAVQWELRNDASEVRKLVRKLRREGGEKVACAHEAGPCGYGLQRQLLGQGLSCQVVAPSLIPRKAGDRIKTDRRDARKLAELLRAGLLTEVRPPNEAEEAVRDLCRCRDDARADLMRARHRLSKMLLRRDLHYSGRAWTAQHRQWLWSLKLEHAAERAVLEDYLLAVDQIAARLAELEARLLAIAEQDPYRERVGHLRCFRGIDTVTAMILLAEPCMASSASLAREGSWATWGWSRANRRAVPACTAVGSPRPATGICVACSSRPPTTTVIDRRLGLPCAGAERANPQP
jgi:transposase